MASASNCKKRSKKIELNYADRQWLEETIGVIRLCSEKQWKTYLECAEKIEKHLAQRSVCRLNAQNQDGNTPLHLAAVSGSLTVIGAILLCGPDVNVINKFGRTPITYNNEHGADYNVGFQFFCHLHKLEFVGEYINEQNRQWYNNARKMYSERYVDKHIAAFTHNPVFPSDVICFIKERGENAIYEMYMEELQMMKYVLVTDDQTLREIMNPPNEYHFLSYDLTAIRLRLTESGILNNNFPLLGCIIKQKCRQSVFCRLPSTSNYGESANAGLVSEINYVQSLKNAFEQGTKLCMPYEAPATVDPSMYSMDIGERDSLWRPLERAQSLRNEFEQGLEPTVRMPVKVPAPDDQSMCSMAIGRRHGLLKPIGHPPSPRHDIEQESISNISMVDEALVPVVPRENSIATNKKRKKWRRLDIAMFLGNETQQECIPSVGIPDEASALVGPSFNWTDTENKPKGRKSRKNARNALDSYSFPKNNVPLRERNQISNPNVDANVDEVTRLLAKIPRPGQES